MGHGDRRRRMTSMVMLGVLLGSAIAMTPMAPMMQDTPSDVPSDQCGVSAILNDDERMELFALVYDGEIHHKWQNYDGAWSNWVGLGGNFTSGAQIVRNIDGRVEIFAVGKDDMLYHNFQNSAGGPYQDAWVPLGGPFSGATAVLTAESMVHVFVRGVDKGLFEKKQVATH